MKYEVLKAFWLHVYSFPGQTKPTKNNSQPHFPKHTIRPPQYQFIFVFRVPHDKTIQSALINNALDVDWNVKRGKNLEAREPETTVCCQVHSILLWRVRVPQKDIELGNGMSWCGHGISHPSPPTEQLDVVVGLPGSQAAARPQTWLSQGGHCRMGSKTS